MTSARVERRGRAAGLLIALVLAACGRGPVAPGNGRVTRDAGPREADDEVRDAGPDEVGDAALEGAGASVLERVAVPELANGRDGVHGMVVFGDGEATWISHLPMFEAPHDVQLVARVHVAGDFAVPTFDSLHTLAPERFRLDDVLAGRRTRFAAALHRGNFEAGGTRLGAVEVTIEAIVVARPLDGGEDGEWYVVGGPGRWWAIHRIGAAPSRDVIGRLRAPPERGSGRYRLRAADLDAVSCLVGPHFTAPCP